MAAAASSLKAAAAHNGATATAVQLSGLSIRTKAGTDSSTAGVEAVPSSPASVRSPGLAAVSSPKSPAMWLKGVGGVSGQYRIWTAAGLEFKNLLGTAAKHGQVYVIVMHNTQASFTTCFAQIVQPSAFCSSGSCRLLLHDHYLS